MRSSISRAPSFSTCTLTFAAGSASVWSPAAAPASASAAKAAARSAPPLRAWGRRTRLEAHSRQFAIAGILDLEEVALCKAEHAGDEHGGEHLDRIVERQHRVVVDLARDRD